MRLTCPYCGSRDLREFTYRGAAIGLARPSIEDSLNEWHEYVHLRDNPAGPTEDLWHHSAGCGAWLRVRRDTLTHEITSVTPVRELPDAC